MRLATNVAINSYNSSLVNKHRWEQWLWACVFALLPLLLWLLLVQVIGVEGDAVATEASRELLFFSLAICTLALSDLRYVEAASRNRKGYETLNNVSLLVILGSAALYGAFLVVHSKPTALEKIFAASIGVASFGFIVGTVTQAFVHRGEDNDRHC